MANSVDPDRTPHVAASDLGQHCLLWYVCPKTWVNTVYKILLEHVVRRLTLLRLRQGYSENRYVGAYHIMRDFQHFCRF